MRNSQCFLRMHVNNFSQDHISKITKLCVRYGHFKSPLGMFTNLGSSTFEKEWNEYKIPGRKRKQWRKCISDIISNVDLKPLFHCVLKMRLRILL